jgi:hypothetical protein
MGNVLFEKHYRVKMLAGLWELSAKTAATDYSPMRPASCAST